MVQTLRVDLSHVRKEAEKARGSKPASSLLPLVPASVPIPALKSLPASTFLDDDPSHGSRNCNGPFPSHLTSVSVFWSVFSHNRDAKLDEPLCPFL